LYGLTTLKTIAYTHALRLSVYMYTGWPKNQARTELSINLRLDFCQHKMPSNYYCNILLGIKYSTNDDLICDVIYFA